MSNIITVWVGSIIVGVVLGVALNPHILGIGALAGGLYLLAIGDS